MLYVTTLVAPHQAPFLLQECSTRLAAHGIVPQTRLTLDAHAARIVTDGPIEPTILGALRADLGVDLFHAPHRKTPWPLFFADMDATIVAEETLDELAGIAGIKDRIAAITTRAMQGQIDFKAALSERLALLQNLPEQAVAQVRNAIHLNEGAATLIQGLKAQGVTCVLISGGFTVFTAHVAHTLGFDAHFGNTLDMKDGRITGKLTPPLIDKEAKARLLREIAASKGLGPQDCVAIGDGANDVPMLEIAGLGVGYYAKPRVEAAVPSQISRGTLATLLYAYKM